MLVLINEFSQIAVLLFCSGHADQDDVHLDRFSLKKDAAFTARNGMEVRFPYCLS